MNQNPYGPPPGPPPGGMGGPPPGGYGPPPGAPPGGYGAYGPPPPPPMGPPGMMQASAPYGIEPMSGLPYSDKSKMIAGLLQLFAGAFGVGRFYTGHIGIAIAQIAVVWLTCGAGILWPMIDGIMMLTGRVTDSEGRPLRPG